MTESSNIWSKLSTDYLLGGCIYDWLNKYGYWDIILSINVNINYLVKKLFFIIFYFLNYCNEKIKFNTLIFLFELYSVLTYFDFIFNNQDAVYYNSNYDDYILALYLLKSSFTNNKSIKETT
jgi:hypothetical protein